MWQLHQHVGNHENQSMRMLYTADKGELSTIVFYKVDHKTVCSRTLCSSLPRWMPMLAVVVHRMCEMSPPGPSGRDRCVLSTDPECEDHTRSLQERVVWSCQEKCM